MYDRWGLTLSMPKAVRSPPYQLDPCPRSSSPAGRPCTRSQLASARYRNTPSPLALPQHRRRRHRRSPCTWRRTCSVLLGWNLRITWTDLLLGLVKNVTRVCVDQHIFAWRGNGLVEVVLAVELGVGRHLVMIIAC